MKKIIKVFGIIAFPVLVALAVFSPIKSDNVSAEDTSPTDISSLTSLSMDGNYKLTSSVSLTGDFTPIGTKASPFKGTFDGNGYTITGLKFTNTCDYQSLFGYTDGATIKNLKIVYKDDETITEGISFDCSGNVSSYYVGSIVGYADNGTKISNCEVENSAIADLGEVKTSATIGGLVGCLCNGSSIINCVNYLSIKFTENVESNLTFCVGGLVGKVENGHINNCVNFGNTEISRSDTISNETQVGGLVGYIKTGQEIRNCVSGGNITVYSNISEIGTIYKGAIVGVVANPITNIKVSNVAYSQDIDKIGNSAGYSINDMDLISLIKSTNFGTDDFYFSNSFAYEIRDVQKEFSWYENGWDKTIFCISNSKIRLQQFQSYTIGWATSKIDNYSVLENYSDGANLTGRYGEKLTIKAKFRSVGDNQYYKILNIKFEGKDCSCQTGISGDIITLTVTANSESAGFDGKTGRYSINLEAKSFNGAVYVDESNISVGQVGFSNGTTKTRNFSKQNPEVKISSSANSQYTFTGWNLYYLASEADAVVNEEIQSGYKKFGTKYYQLQGMVYKGTNIAGENDVPVKIGVEQNGYSIKKSGETAKEFILEKDFLFESTYIYDPYILEFSADNYSQEGNITVTVSGVSLSSNNGKYSIAIGKTGQMGIEISIDKNYKFDSENFLNNIKAFMKTGMAENVIKTESSSGKIKVYSFRFQSGDLDTAKASNTTDKKFSFNMMSSLVEKNKVSSDKTWIIVGASIGGVVFVGVIILVIFLLKRKKHTVHVSDGSDYKKYF